MLKMVIYFLSASPSPSLASTQLACHVIHTALQGHTALPLLYGCAWLFIPSNEKLFIYHPPCLSLLSNVGRTVSPAKMSMVNS